MKRFFLRLTAAAVLCAACGPGALGGHPAAPHVDTSLVPGDSKPANDAAPPARSAPRDAGLEPRADAGLDPGEDTGSLPNAGQNPDYTGASSPDASCRNRYQKVAWSGPLAPALVGKHPSKDTLPAWSIFKQAALDLVTFAKAPDGSVAVKYDVIPNETAWNSFQADPLGAKGLKTACFSYKMYLASGFYQAMGVRNEHGHESHVGKMPRLFGGPKPYTPACSDRQEALKNGAGFSASISPGNWQRLGLYYYDFHDYGKATCGKGPHGDAETSEPPPEGRWVQLDNEVVLNSPNKANGVQRLYIDGKHIVSVTNLLWSPGSRDWGVRGIYFLVGDPRNVALKRTAFYYKDFVIYTDD